MKLSLISLLFLLPITVLADGGLPSQPYIYVQGNAEIEKPADMATLSFDLVARNSDQVKANQEVQARANRVFSLLNDKKIAEKDVIAAQIKSEPAYEDENASRGRSKIVGFKITRTFQAKIRDVTIIPNLVDELLAIAGVEFSGVDSELSNEKDVQEEMWKNSLTDAHLQAEKTLRELGMKIDSVFAVSPVIPSHVEDEIFSERARIVVVRYYSPPEKERHSTSQYRLPPVIIRRTAHVIYLISSAK